MDFHFQPKDFWLPGDAVRWIVVAMVRIDCEMVWQDLEPILYAFIRCGLYAQGEKFSIKQVGDTVLFMKGVNYISVPTDAVN